MTVSPQHDPTAVGGRRALAALIDLIVFLALAWVAFIAMATRIGGDVGDAGCTTYQDNAGGINLCAGFNGEISVIHGGKAIAYLLVFLLIWFAYHGLLQGLVGATPGKLAAGLRLVDREGNPAGVPRALLRASTLAVGWLAFGIGFFIAALIGAVLALGGRDHQRVGDRLAKTYVVRTRDTGRPPSQSALLRDAAVMSTGTPPPPAPQTDR